MDTDIQLSPSIRCFDVEIEQEDAKDDSELNPGVLDPKSGMERAKGQFPTIDTRETSNSFDTKEQGGVGREDNNGRKRKQTLREYSSEAVGKDKSACNEKGLVQSKFHKVVGGKKMSNNQGKKVKNPLANKCIGIQLVDKALVSAEVIPEKKTNEQVTRNDDILLRSSSPDEEDSDTLGFYGLKLEFLKSLNIKPPIGRWVHVANFRCDKHELRDVMELAGRVLCCSVVYIEKRFAKVQYSHPLEAVQAVSMLNGQTYFGLKLKVQIAKHPKTDIILPKGLGNIGIGLGLKGRPVRDIVTQYKNFIRHKKSAINPTLFSKNVSDDETGVEENKAGDSPIDFNEFLASTRTDTFLNERSFIIRHVEDMDRSDDDQDESDKRNRSPDKNSMKSSKSADSNLETKEADKLNGLSKNQTRSTSYDSPKANPLETSVPKKSNHGNSTNDYRINMPENLAVGAPALLSGLFNNAQNSGRGQPGPITMPGPTPNQVPFQPGPGAFGIQSYRPQMQGLGHIGSVPVQGPRPSYIRPGAVPGSICGPGPGPVNASGTVFAPGSAPGTRPVCGPGPMLAPGSNRPQVNTTTVQFSNLPLSTTFPFLCEKLSHCGHVVSLQFTTPGRAVATFSHPSHAERCFQTFNGMNVEGVTIIVTYM